MSQALIPILKEFTKPVYIVLDALDECSEQDQLVKMVAIILDADLPNVHLLLTSRPEVPWSSTSLAKRAVLLSLQHFTRQDIESYLTKQLSDFEFSWSVKREREIKKSLLDRGGGMFRLVSLQLDELRDCDGSDHQINEALATMPSSLDEIYDRIIKNIKKPAMVSAVLRAMNWLIFSERPLTATEIIDALAFDFDQEPLRFSKTRRMQSKPFLQACAGFVTVSQERWNNGQIKLAHASVKEYFLSQKALREPFGDHQHISEQTAHHLLARTCISYLCSIDHVLSEDEVFLQQYPLARYAAKNWVFHTGDLSRKTPRLLDMVLELFQADSTPYLNLCRLDDPDPWGWQREPIHPPVYRSVLAGVGPLVWQLLEYGAEVNAHGGYYGNALQAASYEGDIEIVRLLLQHGAEVNAQGGQYGNALQAASYKGDIEIVRLLLQHGAEVNAQGGQYGNALQAASYKGDIEIVRLLLQHGAEVNAQGGEYGNALQAASYEGDIEIVRLLLQHGAEVNAQGLLLEHGAEVNAQGRDQDGGYLTALQAASMQGQIDIARLLLGHGAEVNAQGRDQDGGYLTALQAASAKGHTKIADLLLTHGAIATAENDSGCPAS
ncbi:ankyrin repeat-containing domain protein [Mycena olivaceomarginata]|nr:ankyrin repeat-containing domain protein [Mycena olivaceomarginata]